MQVTWFLHLWGSLVVKYPFVRTLSIPLQSLSTRRNHKITRQRSASSCTHSHPQRNTAGCMIHVLALMCARPSPFRPDVSCSLRLLATFNLSFIKVYSHLGKGGQRDGEEVSSAMQSAGTFWLNVSSQCKRNGSLPVVDCRLKQCTKNLFHF